MSIRESIEAARSAGRFLWPFNPHEEHYWLDLDSKHNGDIPLLEYIATFDPEHVALMEAVCDAVGEYRRCMDVFGEFSDEASDAKKAVDATDDALAAYRREKGLSDE